MSTLRQALVAVQDPYEGPWQCSRGHEIGIQIAGLGEGETVVLEHDAGSPLTFAKAGRYPFPKNTRRFRFVKQASLLDRQETYVQVILR